MRHWARLYIGHPWTNGGQGPEEFDCWGLVRYVLAHHFDIKVPAVDIDADCTKACALAMIDGKENGSWQKVESPADGDVVLMAHAKYPSHVGLWLNVDNGGVLHCIRGVGVVFSNPTMLRLAGWGKIEYYRYISASTQ